ncbi:hypothetical protein P5P86_15190 [Nocardioides sp. BP30]|uniref:hypothetical protein n=1 Tax=Nocardioides sp. BP30 TaxID=3036374 RepID=UPI002469693F|nr:hypothetical protein [Nocardioides sp. BP30]WGL51298.1 hypothetical protein P5P86_15190 [Nocardioides sp. BP30]
MSIRARGVLAALVLPATLTVTLSACGSGSSSNDRPTTAEISKSLQSGKAAELLGSTSAISTQAADCLATALHDSKLSNKTLQAFVDGDKNYKGSKADESALDDVGTKVTSCLSTAQ